VQRRKRSWCQKRKSLRLGDFKPLNKANGRRGVFFLSSQKEGERTWRSAQNVYGAEKPKDARPREGLLKEGSPRNKGRKKRDWL